ncbi:MAG: HAD family phosphatase [Chloroflexi bacterium]|nr:HAD family phosphatase [Chloroflexota bacterium]
MKMDIKAVIFDMGGVFIRTPDLSARKKMAEKLGMNVQKLNDLFFKSPIAIEAEKGLVTREKLLQYTLQQLGGSQPDVEAFVAEFFSRDEEDQELVQLVRSLKPHYKLALLSNAFEGTRQWMQERFTFLHLFEISIFSYEVGMRKPDEQIYRLVLDKLQVEPQQALFVDDFKENIEGAQRLGIQTVWYHSRDVAFSELRNRLLPSSG